jgi:hypothetical protein
MFQKEFLSPFLPFYKVENHLFFLAVTTLTTCCQLTSQHQTGLDIHSTNNHSALLSKRGK